MIIIIHNFIYAYSNIYNDITLDYDNDIINDAKDEIKALNNINKLLNNDNTNNTINLSQNIMIYIFDDLAIKIRNIHH